jgi:hypothetical protein
MFNFGILAAWQTTTSETWFVDVQVDGKGRTFACRQPYTFLGLEGEIPAKLVPVK